MRLAKLGDLRAGLRGGSPEVRGFRMLVKMGFAGELGISWVLLS